jgi:predicted nucleic acid-binding protein
MNHDVFLDSSYAEALAVARDELHDRALRLAEELRRAETLLVTTHAVLLEIGNALSRLRYRDAAVKLLDSLHRNANVLIVPLAEPLFARAFAVFRQHRNSAWGITDCVSVVVMRDRSMTQALTADDHFRLAGFAPLLLQR